MPALFFFGLLLAYAWLVEPSFLSVRKEGIALPEGTLKGEVRFLLLTDFHFAWHTRMGWMVKKLSRLRAMHAKEPVAGILLGGDFLDASERHLPKLVCILALLAAWDVPLIAVPGNHDYSSCQGDLSPLLAVLKDGGVTVLRNQLQVIQGVAVIGLDDLEADLVYHNDGVPMARELWVKRAASLDWYSQLDSVSPELPRVLLGHNPDSVYLPGKVAPAVVVAGHTHGGQMAFVPPLGKIFPRAIPRGSFGTWAGRQTIGESVLVVSRGIGESSLPLRFLCFPEAVLLTIHSG